MKGKIKGVSPKVRCQIIADFDGGNVSRGKMYTVRQFKIIRCKKKKKKKKNAINRVVQIVDARESVTQKESGLG